MCLSSHTRLSQIALCLALAPSAYAQTPPPSPTANAIAMTAPLTYETGDTWRAAGKRYRLYGVQACIRGTPYVMPDGQKGDCGEASLRMLAGMMATLKVSCTPIAPSAIGDIIVVCAGQSSDKPLDLGAAMIVSGYAFSAQTPTGAPVEPGYYASELRAQTEKAGLWGAKTFTHPVTMLRELGKQLPPAPNAAAPAQKPAQR